MQVEIDEYRDYDKAAGALRDAAKHLAKSKADGADVLMRSLEARTELVERFVAARTRWRRVKSRMPWRNARR